VARTKTSGQGRPKGVQNKATRDVKKLAQRHGPEAIAELWRLSREAEPDAARIAALRELMDRAYGRPAQAITGEGGGPLTVKIASYA
jgi:hypothetical protein